MKLFTYDPAEDLTSDEAIAIFMAEAFQTNDAGYIAHALGIVARAIEQAEVIRLSMVDQECFAQALLSPLQPAPALKRAFARRLKLLHTD